MKQNRGMRTAAVICLLLLTMTAAGCGKGTGSSAETASGAEEASTEQTAGESQTEEAEEETAGASGEEEAANTTEAAEEAADDENSASAVADGPVADSIPAVTTVSWYDDDLFMSVEGPRVLSDGFDALADALRTDNAGRQKVAESYREDLKEDDEYTYEEKVSVTRCDNVVLSFCREAEIYLGQTETSPITVGATFDVYSGQKLTLADVVTSEEPFAKAVLSALGEHPDSDFFVSGWEDTAENLVKQSVSQAEQEDLSWCLRDDALEIIFHKSTLSQTEEVTVELPYAESTNFLKDRYQDPNGGRCHKVDDYGEYCLEYWFDADGDGEDEVLQIDGDYETEDGYVMSVTPIIAFGRDEDSQTVVRGGEVQGMEDSWVIQADDGTYYLYMEVLEENDYHSLTIWNVSDPEKGPVSLGCNETGSFCEFVPSDPEHLYVATRIYMMGTHEGYAEVSLGNDGQLRAEGEPEYRILTYDEADAFGTSDHDPAAVYFTLLRDMTEYVYDINGGDGKDEVLKKGTKLYPYSCMIDSYMVFRTDDGRYVTFSYDQMDEDSTERTIEGIPEEELFDGILYAG